MNRRRVMRRPVWGNTDACCAGPEADGVLSQAGTHRLASVHVGKWSSWSLLVIMTFTIVANLKHIKATISIPDQGTSE